MQKNKKQYVGFQHDWPFAPNNTFCAVAIGYATGGFEALKELITNLPHNISSLSFFIAQPIENEQLNALSIVLQPGAGFSIKHAHHLELIQHGIIYTVNTDQTMELTADGHIKLMPIQKGEASSCIDNLFQSLAICSGQSSVAIVLSGTGNDGAAGVKFVRHAGGNVLVQRPQTAHYNSMPLAAIATNCANEILPAYEMGNALLSILEQHISSKSNLNTSQKKPGNTVTNNTDNTSGAKVKVQQPTAEKYGSVTANAGIEALVKNIIFNSYHHTYIVLDNVNNIVEVSGDTAMYFIPCIGSYINQNIWQVLNEEFKKDVHTAFTNALKGRQLATGHIKVSVVKGLLLFVRILIKKLDETESTNQQYIVILENIETDQLVNTHAINKTAVNAVMQMPATQVKQDYKMM